MIFRFEQGAMPGQMSVCATVGEYDAIPLVDEVTIDAIPWTRHPDRAAVACGLIFNASTAGGFELPDSGCSPHVAAAIEAFFAPTTCKVFPVNYTPSRVVVGNVELHFAMSKADLVDLPAGGSERMFVRLMDEGIGMAACPGEFTISTNVLLLGSDEASPLRRALLGLGVALLFCEDLFVGRVNLAKTLLAGADPTERILAEKTRRLLDSVGLRLRWL